MRFSIGIASLFGALLLLDSPVDAQWRYSAYVQANAGNYLYTATARNYYLSQGLQYRRERWTIEANVSLVARNGDTLRVQGEGMMSGNESVSMNSGIGDVFVRANYALAEQRNAWPSVTIGALCKIPTASAIDGFGTGEWDAGVFLTLARFRNNFYAFASIVYPWFGDPPGVKYADPLSYSIGVGRTFVGNRLGVLALYSGTGRILDEYEAPRQAGMGFNWLASNRFGVFTNFFGGLSETVPDLSFSLGINTAL
jgi:hypothetical protein